MAQDGSDKSTNKPHGTTEDLQKDEFLAPPAVTALKHGAGVGAESTVRHAMERSFSQDIQEGSQELKEAAEQTRNIILDLGLDGIIRWVSPSWTDVVGTHLEMVKGNPISRFIADNPEVFTEAIASLKSDNSKSKFVKFSVKLGPSSDLDAMLREEQRERLEDADNENGSPRQILALEGQGILVCDRASGGESHVSYVHLLFRTSF